MMQHCGVHMQNSKQKCTILEWPNDRSSFVSLRYQLSNTYQSTCHLAIMCVSLTHHLSAINYLYIIYISITIILYHFSLPYVYNPYITHHLLLSLIHSYLSTYLSIYLSNIYLSYIYHLFIYSLSVSYCLVQRESYNHKSWIYMWR